MQLNDEIRKFNQGDNVAFENIVKIMNRDINKIVCKYKIPGHDRDDMRSIALQELLDCLQVRKLKRGTGYKKTLNANDPEIKNKNFIKAAINYRLIRELRSTKSNIRVGYDIPFLQENGDHYRDRKGKPLYIGVIFYNNQAYLIENMKNTKVVLNISQDYINKSTTEYDMKNPIDSSVSFDLVIDDQDNEHDIRNTLEFNESNRLFKVEQQNINISILKDTVATSLINNIHKQIINNLLEKSNNIYELKDYIKNNRKQVHSVKHILRSFLL